MSTFPSITPTSRTLRMAEPAYKEYRALNGVVVRRNFGNRMGNYILELVYENTKEENVIAIWEHYHSSSNQQNRFPLNFFSLNIVTGSSTGNIFAGMTSRLSSKLNLSYIRWFYMEPPNIEAKERGRSTVTVKLVGELNYST